MNQKKIKFSVVVLCILLILCGCQRSSSDYQTAQQNVLFEEEILPADTGVDLSSVDKVYEYADVVVVGTVDTVSLSQYRSDRSFPYSSVTFTCEQVLKGVAVNPLTFSFAGGYVPASQYLQKNKSMKKNLKQSLSEDALKTGYAHVKVTKRPELKENKKYVIFLSKGSDGELTTLGSDYSVLQVKGKSVSDFESKTYGSTDALQF